MQEIKVKDDNKNIKIIETFKSIQGEGPSTGQLANFIRFAGCNLKCSFCDTRYSWDWRSYSPKEEISTYSVNDLVSSLNTETCFLTVFTGGEPLLHQDKIILLINKLLSINNNMRFEIETSGSMELYLDLALCVARNNVQFNVSPKLSNSDNDKVWAVDKEFMQLSWGDNFIFKFIIDDVGLNTLMEIRDFCKVYKIPNHKVWLMGEGSSAERVLSSLKVLMPYCIKNNYNFSTRLHILCFEDTRGV